MIIIHLFANTDNESESVTSANKINNLDSDISSIINLRRGFPNNPMIGNLNILSWGNKINYLREMFPKCPTDIVYSE